MDSSSPCRAATSAAISSCENLFGDLPEAADARDTSVDRETDFLLSAGSKDEDAIRLGSPKTGIDF